jgi:hypothetical protein
MNHHDQAEPLIAATELLPGFPDIRRYRVKPARFQGELGRLLQQQITERVQRTTPEVP